MRKLSLINRAVIAISACFILSFGCSGNLDPVSEGSSYKFQVNGELVTSDTILVNLGESRLFKVIYNSDALALESCELRNTNNEKISGSEAGVVSCSGTEGVFTAPSSMPSFGTDIKIYAYVANTNLTVIGILNVTLVDNGSCALDSDWQTIYPCTSFTDGGNPPPYLSYQFLLEETGWDADAVSCIARQACIAGQSGEHADCIAIETVIDENVQSECGYSVDGGDDDSSCHGSYTSSCFEHSEEECPNYYMYVHEGYEHFNYYNCSWNGTNCGPDGDGDVCEGGSGYTEEETPVCGNGSCESGETSWNCPADCVAPETETCNDGIDNDDDGWIDCADSACRYNAACTYTSCMSNSDCNEAGGEKCLLYGNHSSRFCIVDTTPPTTGTLSIASAYPTLMFVAYTPANTDNVSPSTYITYKNCYVKVGTDDPSKCSSYPTNYETGYEATDVTIVGSSVTYIGFMGEGILSPSSNYIFYTTVTDEAGNVAEVQSISTTTPDPFGDGGGCYSDSGCQEGLTCIEDKSRTEPSYTTCRNDVTAPTVGTISVYPDMTPTLIFLEYDPVPTDNYTPLSYLRYPVCIIRDGVDPSDSCDGSPDSWVVLASFAGDVSSPGKYYTYIGFGTLSPSTAYTIHTAVKDETGNVSTPQILSFTTPDPQPAGAICYSNDACQEGLQCLDDPALHRYTCQ